ncbi:MAG TPA: PKD domain-containing protein [Taishania sp.]|nr:PKD domain-containing protein [Taishania sp.]
MNLSISVNASKGCGPVTAQFSSNATSPIQLTWDFGDGTTSNAYNPTHIYNSENCYAVTLTADNGLGCITTVSLNDSICVYAQPNASFWATPATIENYPYEVQVNNNSTNATNYTWYFGDDTAPSHSFEPSHTYASDASGGFTIMLVASNAIGCVDTAYYGVKIIEDLIFYVPNSFTPDGDQFNNTFKPVFTAGFDKYNYEMIIYNRWGEKVFQTHNTEIGWDGTYNGKMVQDGTYTWKIIVKVSDYDEHKQFVGHVNMIR